MWIGADLMRVARMTLALAEPVACEWILVGLIGLAIFGKRLSSNF